MLNNVYLDCDLDDIENFNQKIYLRNKTEFRRYFVGIINIIFNIQIDNKAILKFDNNETCEITYKLKL